MSNSDLNEEIIAESYDSELTTGLQSNVREKNEAVGSFAVGCPNKWNPYHYCVQFCYDYWKDGLSEKKFVLDFLWYFHILKKIKIQKFIQS